MSINIGGGELKELKPRILVLGVGGAGGNAINAMIEAGMQGVEFVAVNIIHDGTDAYVSSAGSVQSFGLPLLTFSADVSGGNARLRAIPISDDAHVIKFVRILKEV